MRTRLPIRKPLVAARPALKCGPFTVRNEGQLSCEAMRSLGRNAPLASGCKTLARQAGSRRSGSQLGRLHSSSRVHVTLAL